MACEKCGSDWVTKSGKDCNRCPHCDKLQRCLAKKDGRWVDPVQEKNCDVCGVAFECVGLDQIRRRKTCDSLQCKQSKKKAKNKRQRERRQSGIQATRQKPKRPRFCQRCGERLTKSHQKAYCSKACAGLDARERKRPVVGKTIAERLAFDLGSWFWAWDRERVKSLNAFINKPCNKCETCGQQCGDCIARFCSNECKYRWRGVRPCRDCGVDVQDAPAISPVTCKACKSRRRKEVRFKEARKYRTRCRKYGGFYNSKCKRKDVLERDDYVCHLCNRKCRKAGDPNHPRAATVDHHPIPLSKGGDHDWHNVRCACRRCNSRKGNAWGGQKRLALRD